MVLLSSPVLGDGNLFLLLKFHFLFFQLCNIITEPGQDFRKRRYSLFLFFKFGKSIRERQQVFTLYKYNLRCSEIPRNLEAKRNLFENRLRTFWLECIWLLYCKQKTCNSRYFYVLIPLFYHLGISTFYRYARQPGQIFGGKTWQPLLFYCPI